MTDPAAEATRREGAEAAQEMPAAECKPRWLGDADPFFTFLGVYVASFQWMENRIEQMILLARGQVRRAETQRMLAGMSNSAKIEAAREWVLAAGAFPRLRAIPGWLEGFATLMNDLHDVRGRRNTIAHSGYMLERLEDGWPAIRLNRRRVDGAAVFESEEFTRESMEQMLAELTGVAVRLGSAFTQLMAVAEDV